MPVEKITPVLNVSDIAESFAWFQTLGWEPSFSWNEGGLMGDGPHCPAEDEHGPAGFAGVRCGEVSLFLCRDGQGPRGTTALPADGSSDGMWMTWWVSSQGEVDALYEVAVENHIVVTHPPTDEPWGIRECHLRHPDGHVIRVSCGLN